MKINAKAVPVSMFGVKFLRDDKNEHTIGSLIASALVSVKPEGEDAGLAKLKYTILARRFISEDEVEVTPEEAVIIRKAAAAQFQNEVSAIIWEATA